MNILEYEHWIIHSKPLVVAEMLAILLYSSWNTQPTIVYRPATFENLKSV